MGRYRSGCPTAKRGCWDVIMREEAREVDRIVRRIESGQARPQGSGRLDPLLALRSETKAYHDALEEKLSPLVEGISPGAYVSLLRRLLGFYKPLEDRIVAVERLRAVLPDLEGRRKAHLLFADLLHLGMDEADLHCLPVCQYVPRVATVEEALGCLYVLEGATLGGQIITRHLKEDLGLDESGGCAFFYSYGEEVGPMWKSFRSVLHSRCPYPEIQGPLVASARSTFVSLRRWLATMDESEVGA